MIARKINRTLNIRGARRLHDQRRMPVELCAQHRAGIVVPGIARQQQFAPEAIAEFLDRRSRQGDLRTVAGHSVDISRDAGRCVQLQGRQRLCAGHCGGDGGGKGRT